MGLTVVAGGAGFVGSHLVDALVAADHEVVVLDDFSTGRADNLSDVESSIELIEINIADEAAMTGLRLDQVSRVFNLASPASPADYHRLPVHTLMTGATGVRTTLDLARQHGARYLYASTSEVYGDPLVHPQPESYTGNVSTTGPRSVYDEAKRFGEAMVSAYRREYDLDGKIVRLFNTFGPRMRFDDGRAIPNFVHQAITGTPITVAGDGAQTRSICFVDDIVRGLVAMMDSDTSGPTNLGNPEEISMLDLARWIRDLVGSVAPIEYIDRPQDDPQLRQPDISKAARELGWSPQVPPEVGLKATIDAFRSVG